MAFLDEKFETMPVDEIKAMQLKLLKEAGCDLVQGYYFSRPLPVEEFEERMFK